MTKFKQISKRIVISNNSQYEFDKLVKLTQLIDDDLQAHNKPWYFRATNNASEIRNNAQNALYACYIKAISERFGDDAEKVRSFCKRKFGLDIIYMQSSDNTKAGFEALKVMDLLKAVSFKVQTFLNQEAILSPLPCTSIMTSKNFQAFLRQIEIFYAEKGLILESINETLRREAGL